MTQRKTPQAGGGPLSNGEVARGPGGKTSAEYSLQVAFGELQSHLRQSRMEIERLNRQRAKLAAEVEAKTISLGYLQRELDKGERERRALHVKLLEAVKENEELQKRLSSEFETEDAASRRFEPQPPPGFKHPVDLGGRGSDPTESWEGVSRSLLSKMWREMDELQELGKKFAPDSVVSDGSAAAARDQVVREETVEAEDEESLLGMVSALASQLRAARDKLLQQRKMLLALTERAASTVGTQRADKAAISAAKDDAAKDGTAREKEQSGRKTAARAGRSKRTCPVCESSFPTEFPQEEFEDHVMQHMTP